MRNRKVLWTVVCLLAASGGAWAGEDNRITNGGFEEAGVSGMPLGWAGINVNSDEWVTNIVRSGDRAIRLDPAANEGQRFQAFTTNLFLPDGSDLYDPDYQYLGGDVSISGWYLVPQGEVLQDTVVGIKLEFRREPPNFSIWAAFEFNFPASTTGGEWMPFKFVVTDAMIQAVGDFPPQPTSVSILPFRFFGGTFGPGTSPTGTVYIDDLVMTQGDVGGPCNSADFSEPYGVLDFFDVQAFLQAFSAQHPSADLVADNIFDFFDVQAYLQAFSAGCP